MGDKSSFEIREKIVFMGHQHYLPDNHVLRRSKLHNGIVERRPRLIILNGHDILEQLNSLEFPMMIKHPSLKDKERKRAMNWTKRSIFFDLRY